MKLTFIFVNLRISLNDWFHKLIFTVYMKSLLWLLEWHLLGFLWLSLIVTWWQLLKDVVIYLFFPFFKDFTRPCLIPFLSCSVIGSFNGIDTSLISHRIVGHDLRWCIGRLQIVCGRLVKLKTLCSWQIFSLVRSIVSCGIWVNSDWLNILLELVLFRLLLSLLFLLFEIFFILFFIKTNPLLYRCWCLDIFFFILLFLVYLLGLILLVGFLNLLNFRRVFFDFLNNSVRDFVCIINDILTICIISFFTFLEKTHFNPRDRKAVIKNNNYIELVSFFKKVIKEFNRYIDIIILNIFYMISVNI